MGLTVKTKYDVMNYSLEMINTVAACDTLLTSAQKQKQKLERQRRNLGESIVNFNERVDHISNELTSLQSLLDTFIPVYNALPEGSMDKLSVNCDITRLEVRKAQLDRMAITCNMHLLLAKQVDYNRLDSKVSAIDSYITAVHDKRTAVVYQKQQTEKTVYSSQAHFSGHTDCTTKITIRKKVVPLPNVHIGLLLKRHLSVTHQSLLRSNETAHALAHRNVFTPQIICALPCLT
jgi:chromosome segregation ATPase